MNKNAIWSHIITAIITFVCAYIFFALSDKKREPVYSIVKSPSLIFDKNNSSPKIKLLVNDSLEVKENVYITTLAVWNKGNEAIEPKNIRDSLKIACSDSGSKILDHKILGQMDPEQSNFKLIPVGNKLRIDWTFFDPDSGFVVQIIYRGNDSTQIHITGSVLGAKVKRKITGTRQEILGKYLYISMVGILWMVVLFGWIRYFTYTHTKEFLKSCISSTIGSVIMTVLAYILFHESIFIISLPFQ